MLQMPQVDANVNYSTEPGPLGAQRPARPSYRFRGDLPAELAPLAARPQWLTWDFDWNAVRQRWIKPPRHVRTGKVCNGTASANCGPLAVALATMRSKKLAGVGFSVQPDDNLTFIDIDDCLTASGITPLAAEILSYGETYVEMSPSGEGLRLIMQGKIEQGFECDAIGVEVYTAKHYLTITGEKIEGAPRIGPAPRTIARLRAAVEAAKARREPANVSGHDAPRGNLDAGRLADALRCIPSDDRGIWYRVGMALKSEMGDAGFAVWRAWSMSSAKWDEADGEHVWRSIKKPDGGITIGTLFGLAQEHGWQEERRERENTPAAFGHLPDAWAQDPNISDVELCILAYRCTIGDDRKGFGLWEDVLSARPILGAGFSKNVRRRAIAGAVKGGRLERPHNSLAPRGPGYTFQRPTDRLILPEDYMESSRIVWRTWFDGRTAPKQMAALLYIRSQPGRGVYPRELQERFAWGDQATRQVIAKLRDRGIIERHLWRENGRISGVTYTCSNLGRELAPMASEAARNRKKSYAQFQGDGKQGDGKQADGNQGDIRSALPNGESPLPSVASSLILNEDSRGMAPQRESEAQHIEPWPPAEAAAREAKERDEAAAREAAALDAISAAIYQRYQPHLIGPGGGKPRAQQPAYDREGEIVRACDWLPGYLGTTWHNRVRLTWDARRAGIDDRVLPDALARLGCQNGRGTTGRQRRVAMPGVAPELETAQAA